jgi:DNA-binding transcriptional LysR family regulator
LARADGAEQALAELGGLKRGVLSLQASQTISSYWLPRHLVTFRRAHPGIEIRLSIGNTAQATQAVLSGAAELGFIEGGFTGPALTARRIARDQLVIVTGANHPWTRQPGLTPQDLTQSDWVLREPGSGTRSVFEAALPGFGLAPSDLRVALELPSNEAVRGAVEAGMGATALSASVAAPSLEAGLLRLVAIPLPERDFLVLFHTARYRSPAAEALLALLETDPMATRDTPPE